MNRALEWYPEGWPIEGKAVLIRCPWTQAISQEVHCLLIHHKGQQRPFSSPINLWLLLTSLPWSKVIHWTTSCFLNIFTFFCLWNMFSLHGKAYSSLSPHEISPSQVKPSPGRINNPFLHSFIIFAGSAIVLNILYYRIIIFFYLFKSLLRIKTITYLSQHSKCLKQCLACRAT